jgi:8-oxo-dGTP pyrophosphatase MutT (NUDIX family)
VIKVPSVQVALLRDGKDGLEVYLGLRSAGGFLNQWGVTGGKVDKGESDIAAALREVKEETGVELSETDLSFFRSTTSATEREKDGKTVLYEYEFKIYIAVVPSGQEPANVSDGEYSKMGWYSIKEALAMHATAVANGAGLPPDKIPGALTPRGAELFAEFANCRSIEELRQSL